MPGTEPNEQDQTMSPPFLSDHALEQALEQAVRLLQQRDPNGAERVLAPLMGGLAPNPALLHMMGAVRLHQGRFSDGEQLLARARAADPKSPVFAYGHAGALMQLGQMDAAVEAFRTAVKLKPDFDAAWRDLAQLEERLGRIEALEATCRRWLRAMPDSVNALLSLSGVLLQSRRASDSEALLRRGLAKATAPRAVAALNNNLGVALRDQNKNAAALEAFNQAKNLDPTIPHLDVQRADALQRLQRHEEARELYRKLLAAHPDDPYLHQFYNDLLFRLGKGDDYLKSYDRAPRTPNLLKGKAFFLIHEGRGLEAHALYREILDHAPDDRDALAGAARALALAGRHAEAGPAFDLALTRTHNDPVLFSEAARAALQVADPEKAVALCEQGLAVNPRDQNCLSVIGLGWRMMDDTRDEQLSGYDRFVRAFDLEPPEGFSRMEDFNTELNAYLDKVHPRTSENINQSLRNGSQTSAHLFGAGHPLVEKIRGRIDEAVARYIAELAEDEAHPYLSRRAREFRYHGSWSARLRDCGFHVNHIHPAGWISSAYYVQVPDAVQDTESQQGWIKFGEPVFDLPLKNKVRRAVQPTAGRLVLFPSFMWHGTIPFKGPQRTTIAFDVIPQP
jgi:tetratricopeptide (TPR) repeat protein